MILRLANLQIAFRIVPALIAAFAGLAAAVAPSSEGGKRVTGAEAEAIADRIWAKLRPRILQVLGE